MNDDFGAPLEEPKKKNNTTLIIIIVVVVLLVCCCCALAGYFGYNYGDQFLQQLGYY
jgi:flagellar basal body-associated protein FliL